MVLAAIWTKSFSGQKYRNFVKDHRVPTLEGDYKGSEARRDKVGSPQPGAGRDLIPGKAPTGLVFSKR